MGKPKKYYVVGLVVKDMPVMVHGFLQRNLAISWADGMVGACPAFTNKRKAERYAKRHGGEIMAIAKPLEKE